MPRKKKEEEPPAWRNSYARHLLLQDILEGKVTEEDDPEIVHMQRPEWMVHKLSNFKSNMKYILESVKEGKKHAHRASKALAKDRQLHPVANDPRGYPIWRGSEAEELLRSDMDDDKHKQYKPRELHIQREEYQAFPLTVFRNHIHQEIRRRVEKPYWDDCHNKKNGWPSNP